MNVNFLRHLWRLLDNQRRDPLAEFVPYQPPSTPFHVVMGVETPQILYSCVSVVQAVNMAEYAAGRLSAGGWKAYRLNDLTWNLSQTYQGVEITSRIEVLPTTEAIRLN